MKHRITGISARALIALLIAVPALAASTAQPAPDFTLTSNTGKAVSLAQYRGQVVMLNFWASWCGPCRQEMPLLDSIQKKYSKLGFTMIGVNVEPDSASADAFLRKNGAVSFPILYDKQSTVSKLYQVNSMPSTVIIDRKGQVRMLHKGYKPGDENEYLDQIRAMVRE